MTESNNKKINTPEWEFGTAEGAFNEEGGEYSNIFSGWDNPMEATVRECIQNAFDARSDTGVTSIHMYETYIPLNNPSIVSLCEVIEDLMSQAKRKGDKNTKNFAEKAIASLKGIDWRKQTQMPGVNCLVIEDNGRGMTGCESGPVKEKCDFDSFFFHMGQSNKSGTDGGSKGRGKSAFTCISDPRTIFVFTRTEKGTGFAGSTYLATRSIDRKTKILPYGYYVIKDADGNPCAIHEENNDPLYKLFEKKSTGTKVIILGFNAAKDKNQYAWKNCAAEAVIRNCGYLLAQGKLEVEIGIMGKGPDHHYISKDTLDTEIAKLLSSTKSEARADIQNQIKNLRQTPIYFSIMEENDTELYLTISPDANNSISYSRANGIKITSTKKRFGKPFSANVVCSGKLIDQIIRLGENETHKILSVNNISDPQDIKLFESTYKKLVDTITDYLSKVTSEETLPPSHVFGLSNYLVDFRSAQIGNSAPTYKPIITLKSSKSKNGDRERGTGTPAPGNPPTDSTLINVKTGKKGLGHSGHKGNNPTIAIFPGGNIPYDAQGNMDVKKLQMDLEGKMSVSATSTPGIYHVTIYPTEYDIVNEFIYFQFASETDDKPNSKSRFLSSIRILDVFNVNGIAFSGAATYKADINKTAFIGVKAEKIPRCIYGPIIKPAANMVSFDVKLKDTKDRAVYLCLTDFNIIEYFTKIG